MQITCAPDDSDARCSGLVSTTATSAEPGTELGTEPAGAGLTACLLSVRGGSRRLFLPRHSASVASVHRDSRLPPPPLDAADVTDDAGDDVTAANDATSVLPPPLASAASRAAACRSSSSRSDVTPPDPMTSSRSSTSSMTSPSRLTSSRCCWSAPPPPPACDCRSADSERRWAGLMIMLGGGRG